MGEPGRTRAAAEWWRSLSTAWRANIGLYGLATVALVALVAQMATGGGSPPQRVEVASRAPLRTAPTSPRAPTTTVAPTTIPPLTTVPAPTPVAPAPAPPEAANPAPLPLGPAPAQPDTTIDPGPICPKNSVDPACGPLFWDPPASRNQPLSVTVTATATGTPTTGPPGRDVTFSVAVSDPDHPVTDNCAQIDYGDGSVYRLPCNPPQCPDAHGAWEPPPAVAGARTFTYTHHYSNDSFRATFTFHTDRDAPCPNPYGSVAQTPIDVPGP